MAQHLYDPLDPAFGDSAATRVERDRTFHICSDCRMCVKLCPSFRSLFEMIDGLGGSDHTSELSDAQHKRVLDECYQCKLCYVICPYTPDQQQEWRIDFPQLMLRSLIANDDAKQRSTSARLLARTARDEGLEEIAEWLETLARAEKSHAGRFQQALESIT